MQLALMMNPFADTDLQYAQQLGVEWIVGDLPDWDRDTLAAACNRVAKSGLSLSGFASLPEPLLRSALSGGPEAERAQYAVCDLVTEAGALGAPRLGYRWPVAPADGVTEARRCTKRWYGTDRRDGRGSRNGCGGGSVLSAARVAGRGGCGRALGVPDGA